MIRSQRNLSQRKHAHLTMTQIVVIMKRKTVKKIKDIALNNEEVISFPIIINMSYGMKTFSLLERIPRRTCTLV